MRNEGGLAAGRKKLFNQINVQKFLLTVTPLLCLTRQLLAPIEVQVLHAHGKMQLRKVTCEK